MKFLQWRPLFSAVYECKKSVVIALPKCVLWPSPSTCHDGLRRQAVGGERMDGEVFFSGLIFGVSVGVVLGYCLPHRLPPREEQQPEIERLVEQFQELFRQIDREKER